MSSDLLPPNATPQERALSAALARLGEVPVPLADLWDPQACPAPLLPWLAWALHVDDWDPAWGEQAKRDAVAQSLVLHRRKGTPWAVEQALAVAGFPGARVEEWFEYAGEPFHFRVSLGIPGEEVTSALEDRIVRTVELAKNLRSRCDSFVHELTPEGEVPAWCAGLQSTEVVTVWPR